MAQSIDLYHRFRKSMLDKTNDWQALLAPDVKLIGPLAQVQGKDQFIAINEPFFASIKGGLLHQAVELGDVVITQIMTEVIVPSGKTLSLEVCEWYTFTEGHLVSLRVYFDTADLRVEMGG